MEILLLSILILVLVQSIYSNINKKLTKNNYIITNYMYIFTGIVLYALTNTILEQNNTKLDYVGNRILPLFILTLLALFGILFTPSNQQLQLHLLWIGFVILLSVTGYPIYLLTKQEKMLGKVLLTLAVIFMSMSYLAYSNKIEWLKNYYSYFVFGLLGLIVFMASDMVFSDINKEQETRFWYYSLFAIFIFSGLLIFDTQRTIKEGTILEETCKNISHLKCANYPKKSISIFLDLLNLFNNVSNVMGR